MDQGGHINRSSQPAPNVLIQHNPLPPSGGPHVMPGISHSGYVNRPTGPPMGQYPAGHGPGGGMRGMPMGSPSQPPMLSLQQQVSSSAVMQSTSGGMGMMDSRSMPVSSGGGGTTSMGTYSRAPAPSQFRLQPGSQAHNPPATHHSAPEGMMGNPPVSSDTDPPKSSIGSFDSRPSAPTGYSAGTMQSQGNQMHPNMSAQPRMTPGIGNMHTGLPLAMPQLAPLDSKNGVSLCRQGKERSLEITLKIGELFGLLKTLDLPGMLNAGQKANKQMALNSLNERLHYILLLMERLDSIWSHLESLETENGTEIKFSQEEFLNFLICHKAEIDAKLDNEEGRALKLEREKLLAELEEKNKQLDKMTDVMRSAQWETAALLN